MRESGDTATQTPRDTRRGCRRARTGTVAFWMRSWMVERSCDSSRLPAAVVTSFAISSQSTTSSLAAAPASCRIVPTCVTCNNRMHPGVRASQPAARRRFDRHRSLERITPARAPWPTRAVVQRPPHFGQGGGGQRRMERATNGCSREPLRWRVTRQRATGAARACVRTTGRTS
jgi:hypothetical protein